MFLFKIFVQLHSGYCIIIKPLNNPEDLVYENIKFYFCIPKTKDTY